MASGIKSVDQVQLGVKITKPVFKQLMTYVDKEGFKKWKVVDRAISEHLFLQSNPNLLAMIDDYIKRKDK